MLLSPVNKSGNSFNFYVQKSIARWEPSLKEVPFTNNLKTGTTGISEYDKSSCKKII